MREARVERKTAEVDILVELNIDGRGRANIDTGIQFLNHLLNTLAKHSLFDIKVKATGDLKHHIGEDVALTLGEALQKAVAEKKGIKRFSSAYVPMDESLARAVVDLGGRAYSHVNLKLRHTQIEDLRIEDIEHFFESFIQASKLSLHLSILYGGNDHHKIESAVKALAIALRQAVAVETRIKNQVPSAKGIL